MQIQKTLLQIGEKDQSSTFSYSNSWAKRAAFWQVSMYQKRWEKLTARTRCHNRIDWHMSQISAIESISLTFRTALEGIQYRIQTNFVKLMTTFKRLCCRFTKFALTNRTSVEIIMNWKQFTKRLALREATHQNNKRVQGPCKNSPVLNFRSDMQQTILRRFMLQKVFLSGDQRFGSKFQKSRWVGTFAN